MPVPAFTVALGRPEDYPRMKQILNRGRHPTFVGRMSVARQAIQGGLLFCQVEGQDAGVAVINVRQSTALVFCFLPSYQGQGLGTAFMNYLRPNFARVITDMVPFFEQRLGYTSIGEPKQGRTLRTQIMVRTELLTLAGRVHEHLGAECHCSDDLLHA